MSSTPWAGRRLHFIGVGGAGMSGLALVAQALGAEVTGSDQTESSYLERLRHAGLGPVVGHDAANVPDGAEIVVSTAIPEDNPELAVARDRGAVVLHRGDLLAEVTRLRRTIAVAGTHGKTTTASMAVHVLAETGRDPSYLIGGEVRSTGTNAAWGEGEWLVVEADESDRSFLKLTPEVAVITNVELDHHTTFASLGELEDAFRLFADSARAVISDFEEPAVDLLPLGSRFKALGTEFELSVPGRHNALNALAAALACREAGVEPADAAAALRSFSGAGRRFEPQGAGPAGSQVYDDYAHHPTEVRATLEAARSLGAERIVACFQPHLYSRTRHLAGDFGKALALADVAVVLDVYPARERAEDYPGVSGWLVAAATADVAGGRPVYWAPDRDDAERLLRSELREGDAVLTLGAGDIDALARALTAIAESGSL